MVIGVCSVFLRIPANHSLKGKRQVLQSIVGRVRRDFNVSIAEVDQQDSWQAATLGISCVSSDAAYAHGLLSRVVEAISSYRIDAEVVDFSVEIC
jgi:uncharacterized protein YlxP (DUF503 family)